MPLLGTAAMLLSFDVLPEAVAEHDHWHTHEHLPERLAIPGFLRGSRWVALPGQQPRYMVLYEVRDLATLDSEAYLARLNQPTPWTRKMMPHYRSMQRGLCAVVASAGLGSGHLALLTRFSPAPGAALASEQLARLAQRPGLGGVHLLQGALAAQMTQEQRIRGADAGVDGALLVTGYDQPALEALARTELSPNALQAQGAQAVVHTLYRLDYTLMAAELAA